MYWSEIYDPKEGRTLREIPYTGRCKKCEMMNGHRLDCEEVTLESLFAIAKRAQKSEEHYRKMSNRYLTQLKEYQGKIAVLKHENNKLRRANEKLKTPKKTNSDLDILYLVRDGKLVVSTNGQVHAPVDLEQAAERLKKFGRGVK